MAINLIKKNQTGHFGPRKIEDSIQYLETHLGKGIYVIPATDGINLVAEAWQAGKRIASIYNSFSRSLKPVFLLSFARTEC